MRMEHKVKALQETMTIFNERKTGLKRILFSIDELDTKLLKKLKKSSYTKDKQLLKLIDLLENNKKKKKKIEEKWKLIDLRLIALMVFFSSCTLTSPI